MVDRLLQCQCLTYWPVAASLVREKKSDIDFMDEVSCQRMFVRGNLRCEGVAFIPWLA